MTWFIPARSRGKVRHRTGTGIAAPYVAAECALEGLSLALANQLSCYDVTVAIIVPGFIRTQMLDESPRGELPGDDQPYGRLIRRSIHSFAVNTRHAAEPERVAEAVLDVMEGRGKLRVGVGDEMDRLFERLGVDGWTAAVEAYFLPDDDQWAAAVSDLFGRDIPPPSR